MADSKITALTAITTVNPATYPLVIVDTSDTSMAITGTTKKVTTNQLLGSGGTATLASATITGDLTVRTNKLKVTSIGVGAGTTTPAAILHSTQTTSYDALILDSDSASTYCTANWKVGGVQKAQAYLDFADDSLLIRTNTATGPLKFGCNNILQHRIDPLGVFNWYDGAGGTRMTLNSTGLGIAGSPVSGNKLFVEGSAQIGSSSTAGSNRLTIDGLGTVGNVPTIRFRSGGATKAYVGLSGSYIGDTSTDLLLTTDAAGASVKFGSSDTGTVKMTLDASGNLLVGTTSGLYRGQFAVTSGADRSIFAAQVTGASNGLQVQWNHATTTLRVILANIPTSSAGLASGTLWNDAGTIKIV